MTREPVRPVRGQERPHRQPRQRPRPAAMSSGVFENHSCRVTAAPGVIPRKVPASSCPLARTLAPLAPQGGEEGPVGVSKEMVLRGEDPDGAGPGGCRGCGGRGWGGRGAFLVLG